MEENKKLTKKDYYAILRQMTEENLQADERYEDVLAFIDKQVELLDSKAEKNKIRAAEKRAEGDELRATIKGVLTDEYQTINDIVAQISDEEITKAKVTPRLTALVKLGEAEKDNAKTEDGKRVVVYRLAQ